MTGSSKRSTSFPVLTTSLTGACFLSTIVGGIRCSSRSRQTSAICARVVSLGVPKETTRAQMAEVCLEREEQRIPPTIVDKKHAPVKEVVKTGKDVDLFELPVMRHHHMDGGPYIVLSTITKDRKSG